ncbi:DUF6776 family protein [Thiolapillus brandeum]|uniref:Uncharacterized protein n=1 Tax=Thiolapillus brandeum TaxID=1076588 RepID=A0A7U6GL39_9GAMM|nr:DUF6776 family protein [Thiolapillus brandeum]BAO45573.1 hypothetical protein TBH_C2667 [Thiolapillus brandeum]
MKPVSSTRVKPKRVKSPRIVHQHDRRSHWQIFLLLALLAGIAWQAYSFGVRQGGFNEAQASRELARLTHALDHSEAALKEAHAEAVRYRRQAEIEVDASRALQEQLVGIEKENASLKSDVKMLRSLISDDNGSLYVRNLVLRQLDEAGHYHYAFSLVQVLEKVDVTKGKLLMKISGKLKGKRKRLDRSEFSEDGEKVLKLEFSNYQDVAGEIILPEDFKPEKLLIEFLPRNKELKKMSRHFSWNDYLLSSRPEMSDIHE